jgi:hypothetical protein
MRTRVVLLVAVLLVVPLACGDDDDADGGDVAAEADTGSADVDADVALGSEECREALEAMGKAVAGSPAPGADLDDIEQAYENFGRYADAAPDEIRDEMQLLAEAFREVGEVLADLDYDPASGETPSEEDQERLAEIGSRYQDEEFVEASERVNEWFEDECGT